METVIAGTNVPRSGVNVQNKCNEQKIVAVLNLRPQDRFANPKGYELDTVNDVSYCSFKINAPRQSGIYRIRVNGETVYIGRAKSLHNRLSVQYGTVSPRHPFKGGQIQKCRTNAKINKAINQGHEVSFEWEVCADYIERERALLSDSARRPSWNLRG